jgi:hypothetical protein
VGDRRLGVRSSEQVAKGSRAWEGIRGLDRASVAGDGKKPLIHDVCLGLRSAGTIALIKPLDAKYMACMNARWFH